MKKAVIALAVVLAVSISGNIYQLVEASRIKNELTAQDDRAAGLEADIGKLSEELEVLKQSSQKELEAAQKELEDEKTKLEAAQNALADEQKKAEGLEAKIIELTAELERQKSLNTKLSELTAEQLAHFSSTAKLYVQDVLDGKMTLEECEGKQNGLIEDLIEKNELPLNAVKLFGEWKLENDWYSQFTPPEPEPEPKKETKKDTKTDKKKDEESKESSSDSKSWDEMTQEEKDAILAEFYGPAGPPEIDDRFAQDGKLPDWLINGDY